MSGTATLYTVVPAKGVGGKRRTVLGCDLTAICPAPCGDLVRVCFDVDDDRAGRDRALYYANLFLPLREGFRHFVVAEGDRTFVIGLCPDQDGDDDVVVSKLHSFRSSASGSGDAWNRHHDRVAEGRPVAASGVAA